MPNSVRYRFRQHFTVPAQKAFEWCTDYQAGPEDHVLMGDENADRKLKRVSESTIILTDIFHTQKGIVEKKKLVELYPNRLSWNATHLSGPVKYSQFLYEISPDGEEESQIDFTGLYLDYEHKNLSKEEAKQIAERLCKEDHEGWKLLAKALARELK